nr:calcium homeostasis endoplasmic reticulum protein-like isoform X1 [Hydra vulgaris]
MSYTRACWVEKNKDYKRVIPSSWVDTARKVVHWPNGLQVKRAYENLETPKPGWKQFSLIKCKMCGTKEDCEGCTDYTTTDEQPTAPKEKIISEKENVYSNILPTFPTQNPRDIPLAKYQQSKPQHSNRISQQSNLTKIKESSSKHSKSNPVEPPPPRVVHSQCSSLSRSCSRSNSQSRSHSRSRSRLQSKSHSQSKSYSRSQLHYSRSRSNSDSSRSSYSNSNVTCPGLVEVSPIVYKSSCMQRKDAVVLGEETSLLMIGIINTL